MKYKLLLALMCFLTSFLLSAQSINYADSVSFYHEYASQSEHAKSARLAFNIGEFYFQKDSLAYAKKFYNYSFNDAGKSGQQILEARAVYKQGVTEKKMAESGRYGMEEEQEYFKSAIRNLKKAHGLFQKAKMGGSYEAVLTLINGGEAQFIIGDYKEAVKALNLALNESQKNRYDDLSYQSSDLLVQCYAGLNDGENMRKYQSINRSYQEFFISKDSLAQTVEKVERLLTTNELQKAELELRESEIENMNLKLEAEIVKQQISVAIIKQNAMERKMMIGGIGIIFIFLVAAIIAIQYMKKTNRKLGLQNKQILEQKEVIEKRQKELNKEKTRTDQLLLNILPAPIAEELKANKKVTPRYYKKVTVMFTDFNGFTAIAAQLSPGEVVRELDNCFVSFDQIIDNYEQAVKLK